MGMHTCVVDLVLKENARDFVLDEARGLVGIAALHVKVRVKGSGLDGEHEIA